MSISVISLHLKAMANRTQEYQYATALLNNGVIQKEVFEKVASVLPVLHLRQKAVSAKKRMTHAVLVRFTYTFYLIESGSRKSTHVTQCVVIVPFSEESFVVPGFVEGIPSTYRLESFDIEPAWRNTTFDEISALPFDGRKQALCDLRYTRIPYKTRVRILFEKPSDRLNKFGQSMDVLHVDPTHMVNMEDI